MSTKFNFHGKLVVKLLIITLIFSLAHPATSTETEDFQKVDPNEVPNELAMLAAVTRANFEKIKTLQGKASIERILVYRGSRAAKVLEQFAGITSIEPNQIADITKSTSKFKIDLEKDLFFKFVNIPKPSELIDLENGTVYQTSFASVERAKIITEEYEIETRPYRRNKDGTISSRIAEKQPRKYPQIITDDSDPRIGFNIDKPVCVFLTELSDGLRNYRQGIIRSFYGVVLEKAQTEKGITYRVQLIIQGGTKPSTIFVLDGEKGFNPTHFEHKNSKNIKVYEIIADFNEIDGIFVPCERRYIQYDVADGRFRQESKSTFSDVQVNVALPENTFTYKNLGLKDGDKFVDKILDKEYIYKNEELIPVTKED